MSLQAHWDDRYENNPASKLSWYQERSPDVEFVVDSVGKGTPIIDIGGGLSPFVDQLVDHEFTNLTVLDISAFALAEGQKRIPGKQVEWIQSDIRTWQPERMYGMWHDRAVFHFLTEENDQMDYWAKAKDTLVPGGYIMIGCFSENGPEQCSGLPVARHSTADLMAAMGDEFEVIEATSRLHRTPSGGEQEFAWVTAQRT